MPSLPTATLPAPGPEAAQHSAQLCAFIRRDIAEQGGWISFARYMELALYAPGLGYYTAGAHKFGAAGDFITAPELSPLFGHTLARQVIEIMAISAPHILELGAGSGKLAADMLGEMERTNSLPDSYAILEVSADLRARQQALLKTRLPHLLERIHWLDTLPEKFSGAVVANEVLDALPVYLLHWCNAGRDLSRHGDDAGINPDLQNHNRVMSERGVANGHGKNAAPDNETCHACTEPVERARFPHPNPLPEGEGTSDRLREFHVNDGNGFVWQERAVDDGRLLHAAQQIVVPDNYLSEICLAARGLVNSLASCLEQGALLFIDYGFGAREYYHPQRSHGTLMCHYRHHAHDDPFFLPGLQDITAHVNFTDIAENGIDAGLELLGYTSQAFFLLNCGITDQLQNIPAENLREYLPLSAQLQKLTSPAEMGELFKVMALGKGVGTPLCGFVRGDLTRML